MGGGKPSPLLPWFVLVCGAVRGRLQRAARLVLLVAKRSELFFPSYLPGRFAGGSNLLGQGGRGRGGCPIGGEGRVPCDRPHAAKEKDPTAFLSFFFFLCLLA